MKTFNKFLAYTFGAIGAYLVVSNSTGFGNVMAATDSLYTNGVSTLQARNSSTVGGATRSVSLTQGAGG